MQEINLVFIHLGPNSPKYLWLNLQRHLDLFPNHNICIIVDDARHLGSIPKGVKIYVYENETTPDWIIPKDKSLLKFRRGYWRFTAERFLAAEKFQNSFSDLPMLHIESDVILFPNFPFDKLISNQKAMWCAYGQDYDVAACLYFPTKEYSSSLVRGLEDISQGEKTFTDMTALRYLAKQKIVPIEYFPVAPYSESSIINERSLRAKDVTSEDFCSRKFDGIFDGIAIGMWLTGHDPRNDYGRNKLHDKSPAESGDSIIDPSQVDFSFDDSGNFSFFDNNHERVNIWTLHVHSKNLNLFSDDWRAEMQRLVSISNNKFEIRQFSRKILFQMLIESLKGGTFRTFFLGLPAIHFLRRLFVRLVKFR